MPPAIIIVNDTIIPGPHSSIDHGLTPREAQVRIAFFMLAASALLVGAIFSLCTTRRWWTSANLWSLPRLCALWFITIAAFATITFVQFGRATRSTFVLAIVHGMVEISIISLLLDGTLSQSLILAMAFAFVDFTVAFTLPNIGHVFMVASILGGMNDFLMPLLLVYGRQPLLAIGGFAHTAAAVAVFIAIVYDYGVISFTIVSFVSLWFFIGFIIAGLRVSRISEKEYPTNPMKASVSPKILALLVSVSLIGSTSITLLLTYVAPK